ALKERLGAPAEVAADRRRRLEGVRLQARSIVHQVVESSQSALGNAGSIDDVKDELERFRRNLEVHAEEATRIVLRQLVDDPTRRETLINELADWSEATVHLATEEAHAVGATARGAAVGGVLGGAGLTLLATALGPVGLVAGALAGSLLGRNAAKSQTVRAAKEHAIEVLHEIADELANDLDDRIEAALHMVERRETNRRDNFEADLRSVLEHLTSGDETWRAPAAELRELCAEADAVRGGALRVPTAAA
ncbi:MAG: hypothetical protein R3320_14170, partial [Nitriliruptorales bacterium]|nr:hypothetical protein [Nitriliruptorales bacterium]